MIKFKVLILSVEAGCKRPLIMDPHFFIDFSNTNLIVWFNVFASQKILNIIIVLKYCIATKILLFKSISRYGKFIFLS